jgi:MFS family permease
VPLRLLLLPPWRRRLALVAAAAALGAIFFSPAGLLVALFGSRELRLSPASISAVVVVSGLISAPAFLLGGPASDRWGRRSLAVGLTAATALAAATTFAGGTALYWSGNVVWSFLASASVPVLGAWYGELFPTRARATSEAAIAVAAAVGGIAGLQLVGAGQPRLGLGPSLLGAALPALAAAALLALLPETGGEPLPD